MKRLISVILTVAMCISAFSFTVNAVKEADLFVTAKEVYSGTYGDNVNWSLNTETGVLDITGTGDMTSTRFTSDIPWYSDRIKVKTVNISNGVTSIGGKAFYNCSYLTSIAIPNSVTSIGTEAFYNCSKLVSINIPDSVTSIGDSAFYCCYKLASVNIPNGVASIGDWTFNRCESLTSIAIPDSVTSIGNQAFSNCSKLVSVTIGNGVTSIGNGAFYSCYSLTSINIPYGVTSIGVSAFEYCSKLANITIPNSVISIGNTAFKYCSSFTSVAIPDSVASIGDGVFECSYYITSVNVDSNNAYYSSVDGVLFNKNKTTLIYYPAGKTDTAYTIPDSVTTIGEDAFLGCDLTNIDIPNGVTSIEASAFLFCSSFTSLTIPNSVTSIGFGAFQYCSSLTSIIIGNSVTFIDNGAFNGCDSLETVYYAGSQGEWNKITIGYSNTCLTDANIIYNYVPNVLKNIKYDHTVSAGAQTFTVVDYETGEPIPGAKVTCFGVTETTNAQGAVNIDCPLHTKTELIVEKANYARISMEYVCGNSFALKIIKLKPAKGNVIYPVSCNGIDISTQIAQINKYAALEAEIEVKGSSENAIKMYELIQGKNVIATSKDGKFTARNNLFDSGIPVKVVMYTSDGKKTTEELNINVIAVDISETLESDLAWAFAFLNTSDDLKLDDSLQLFSGIGLNIKGENGVAIETVLTNDCIKIGINQEVESIDTSKLNKGLREWMEKQNRKTPSSSIDFEIAGYLVAELGNIGIGEVYGEMQFALSYKKGFGQRFVIPVVSIPCKVDVTFSIKGEMTISKIGFDFENKQLLLPELDFDLELGIGLKVGVDLVVAAIGVYGDIKGTFETQIVPKLMVEKITASGDVGLYARLLFLEGRLSLVKGTFTLYEYDGTKSMAMSTKALTSQLYDLSNYRKAERTYLASQSSWNPAAKTVGDYNVKHEILQSSAYTGAAPQTVNGGDVIMSVYADDNGNPDGYNYQQLVYTIYNPETQTWSAPVGVDNNNLVDSEFKLYTDGNDIYIAYSEANREFTDADIPLDTDTDDVRNAKFAAVMGANEIVVAKYNKETNSFDRMGVLTEDDKGDFAPSISVVDGKLYAAWAKNTGADVFGTAGMMEVYVSAFDGESWTTTKEATALNQIGNLEIGELENGVAVVASVDADGDILTPEKNAVLFKNGTAVKTIEGATKPSFATVNGVSTVMWSGAEGVYGITSLNGEAVQLLDFALEDYKVVSNGDTDVILFTAAEEEGETELYGVFGVGSAPVKLTATDGYFDQYGAVLNSSELIAFYVATTVAFTEESFDRSCDLCCAYIDLGVDLSLEAVEYNYDEILESETVTLTAYVANNGSESINGFTITDGNGFEYIYEGTVASGEVVAVEYEYTFTNGRNASFTVNVDDDLNAGNNLYELKLEVSEFGIMAEQVIIADKNYISLSARNYGTVEGEATIKILADNAEGELLYKEDITLDSGNVKVEILELPEEVLAKADTFYVEIIPAEEEYNLADNFCYVYIQACDNAFLKSLNDVLLAVGEDTLRINEATVSFAELKANLKNENIEIVDMDGNILTDENIVGTGAVISVVGQNNEALWQYGAIVVGDMDGDGIVVTTDAIVLVELLTGGLSIGELFVKAADLNGDGIESAADYLQLKQRITSQNG